MVRRTFSVRAVWDDEAGVYYAESDIIGLHIEAASIDEFEALMFGLAPDLIVANHIPERELSEAPLADLIPAILWHRPDGKQAAA